MSFTEKSRISTIAATKEGIAAETAVTASTLVSRTPRRSPATSPSPIPMTRINTDAYRTRAAVVPIREAISVETFSRRAIEMPKSP